MHRLISSLFSRKLQHVLTNKLLKFFADQARKEPETYQKFYEDYGLFFREGIVTSPEQEMRVTMFNTPVTMCLVNDLLKFQT